MRSLLQRTVICLLVIALPAITIAQQSFSLKGTFRNLKNVPSAVYMKSMEDTSVYKVPVIRGGYLIKGKLNGPTKFNILPVYSAKTNRPPDANAILFIYLENGHSYITHFGRFSKLKVKGSAAQAAEDTLQGIISKAGASGASKKQINDTYGLFAKEHTSSRVAVYKHGS